MRLTIHLTALLLATASLAGCLSFSYVDSDNVRHVVGLVDVAIRQEESARAIRVTGIGLSAFSAQGEGEGKGLVLGYSEATFLSLEDGACIDLNTPGLCADRAKGRIIQGDTP